MTAKVIPHELVIYKLHIDADAHTSLNTAEERVQGSYISVWTRPCCTHLLAGAHKPLQSVSAPCLDTEPRGNVDCRGMWSVMFSLSLALVSLHYSLSLLCLTRGNRGGDEMSLGRRSSKGSWEFKEENNGNKHAKEERAKKKATASFWHELRSGFKQISNRVLHAHNPCSCSVCFLRALLSLKVGGAVLGISWALRATAVTPQSDISLSAQHRWDTEHTEVGLTHRPSLSRLNKSQHTF